MTTADALLLANAASTWGMVGVIWFVQRVHYPLFSAYRSDDFARTEAEHQSRTTPVVFPLMLAELLTSLALVPIRPVGVADWCALAGVACVGVWGFSTALVQIPLHEKLAGGFDAAPHRRLVATNWLRTAAWSLHGGVTILMLHQRLGATPVV